MDDFIEVWKRRKKAGHTVKTLFPPHTMANAPKSYSGFTVFKTDNTEDVMHYVTCACQFHLGPTCYPVRNFF